jgi:hypothetical protein
LSPQCFIINKFLRYVLAAWRNLLVVIQEGSLVGDNEITAKYRPMSCRHQSSLVKFKLNFTYLVATEFSKAGAAGQIELGSNLPCSQRKTGRCFD